MRPRLLIVLAGLVVLAVLAALAIARTGGDAPAAEPEPTPLPTPGRTPTPTRGADNGLPEDVGRYVALGDSYTAGPLIPWMTEDQTGCLRSTRDYPAVLAQWLRPDEFVDVSCSGADTRDLTAPQESFGPPVDPQLDSVTPDTDLVTMGLGGNDFDLFVSLASGERPDDVFGTLHSTGDRLSAAVRAIHDRAPDAVVALVGYPRIVPESGSCDELGFAADDVRWLERVERALNAAIRAAAEREDALYVDTYRGSQGHDVCAADPWVNGRTTETFSALAYHPFAEGMTATAVAVHEALRGAPPTAAVRRAADRALSTRPHGTLSRSQVRLVSALLGGA